MALKCQPDHAKGERKAEERFKEVSSAYDVLGDEAKRKEYDEVRRLGAMSGGRGPSGGGPGGFTFNVEDRELALVAWALEENAGYLPRAAVEERGWSHRDARRLLKEWEQRGWLEKDPNRGNSRKVTIELAALAAQVPNLPSPAQPPNPAQGAK